MGIYYGTAVNPLFVVTTRADACHCQPQDLPVQPVLSAATDRPTRRVATLAYNRFSVTQVPTDHRASAPCHAARCHPVSDTESAALASPSSALPSVVPACCQKRRQSSIIGDVLRTDIKSRGRYSLGRPGRERDEQICAEMGPLPIETVRVTTRVP